MRLYVIIFTHKHGTDAWPRFDTEQPGEDAVIDELRKSGEWDEDDDERGSYIEIRGPFDVPKEAVAK